jgi:acyl-CoA synthetase (NDP forming)
VPTLAESPVVPDVAMIAVSGQAAVDAVGVAADMGVKGCIVMASGFGETGTREGERLQTELLAHAARGGVRVVGPNSQGLASFHTGAALSFSTLFTEEPPLDGPVSVVSQSGAMASVPYGMLRRRGIGVRYAHGTGNDIDVSAIDLAAATLDDPEVRLLLLYLENIRDRDGLVALAEASQRTGTPVVALVGGRSDRGSRAAASHTGALASERRVLDAFFARLGIWSVSNVRELVQATELYLQDWQPGGDRLAVVSNSGALCVLAADSADAAGLPLAEFAPTTVEALRAELPAFAATGNPVDVTAALLTDSGLFGRVLPVLAEAESVDACLLGIPVAGRGYDVERFARDASTFAAGGTPLVIAANQPNVIAPFAAAGLPVFEEEDGAVRALAQFLHHRRLLERAAAAPRTSARRPPAVGARQLDEAASLSMLEEIGVPVVAHEVVTTPEEAAAAFDRLGAAEVVVKGRAAGAAHKSELGLVRLRLSSAVDAVAAATAIAASAAAHGVQLSGFVVAPMVRGLREVLLGAHIDPVYGPVVVIGAGGVHVEALADTQVLVAPCTAEQVRAAIARLHIAPLLGAVRGEPASDVEAWTKAVVRASEAIADPASPIAGFDANPVLLLPAGEGCVAVDALVLACDGCEDRPSAK